MTKKTLQIEEKTHTELNILRAKEKLVTFTKTIQFLINKYKEQEK